MSRRSPPRGPSRGATAPSVADERTGDIYIMDAASKAQFHLTVELAPSADGAPSSAASLASSSSSRHGSQRRPKQYTKVTGKSVKTAVEKALVPLLEGQHPHRYALLPLVHGKSRRPMHDDTRLPNGAIVEVTPCDCGCRYGRPLSHQAGAGIDAVVAPLASSPPSRRPEEPPSLPPALSGRKQSPSPRNVPDTTPTSPRSREKASLSSPSGGARRSTPPRSANRRTDPAVPEGARSVPSPRPAEVVQTPPRHPPPGKDAVPDEAPSRDAYYTETDRKPSPERHLLQRRGRNQPSVPSRTDPVSGLANATPSLVTSNPASGSYTPMSPPSTASPVWSSGTEPLSSGPSREAAPQQPPPPTARFAREDSPYTAAAPHAFVREGQEKGVNARGPPTGRSDTAVPPATATEAPSHERQKHGADQAPSQSGTKPPSPSGSTASKAGVSPTTIQPVGTPTREVGLCSSSSSVPTPATSAPQPHKAAAATEKLAFPAEDPRAPFLRRTSAHHPPPAGDADPIRSASASASSISFSEEPSGVLPSGVPSLLRRPSVLDRTQEPKPQPPPPESLFSEDEDGSSERRLSPARDAGRGTAVGDRPVDLDERRRSTSTATSATVVGLSVERVRPSTSTAPAAASAVRGSSGHSVTSWSPTIEDASRHASSSRPSRLPSAGVPHDREPSATTSSSKAPSLVSRGVPSVEPREDSQRVKALRAKLAEREAVLAQEQVAADAKLAAMHAYMDAEKAKVTERYDRRVRALQKEMEKQERRREAQEAASARERRYRFADRQMAEETAHRMQDLLHELNSLHDGIFAVWSAVLAERQRRESPPLTAFDWQAFHQKGKSLTWKLCESVAYKHVYSAQWRAVELADMGRQKELDDLLLVEKNLSHAEEEAKGNLRLVVRVRPARDAVLRWHRLRRGTATIQPPQERSWRETVDELLTAVAAAPSPYNVHVDESRGTVALQGRTKGPRELVFDHVYGPLVDVSEGVLRDRNGDAVIERYSGSAFDREREADMERGLLKLSEEEDQARVFEEQLAPVLEDMCRRGRNVAVLGYGTTGSGKTHTLLGASLSRGLYTNAPHGTGRGDRDGSPSNAASTTTTTSEDDDDDEETLYQWCISSSAASSVHSLGSSDDDGGAREPQVGDRSRAGKSSREGISAVDAPVSRAGRHPSAASSQRGVEGASTGGHGPFMNSQQRRRRRQRESHVKPGDGLLPRTLAWLCNHARDPKTVIFSRKPLGQPEVLSFRLSAFEVYKDHVYDLLAEPIPPSQEFNVPYKPEQGLGGGGATAGGGIRFTVSVDGQETDPIRVGASAKTSSSSAAAKEDETARGGRQDLAEVPNFAGGKRWDDGRPARKDAFRDNPHRLVELIPFHAGTRRGCGGTGGVVDTGVWTVAAEEVSFLLGDGRGSADGRARPEVDPKQEFKRAMRCLQHAVALRRTAATARNTSSSRSHMFVKLRVVIPAEDESGGSGVREDRSLRTGTREVEVMFCDLAGSERVNDSAPGAPAERRREAQYINRSLCAVSDVLQALARRPLPMSVIDAAKEALRSGQSRPQADLSGLQGQGLLPARGEGGRGDGDGVSPSRMQALLLDISGLSAEEGHVATGQAHTHTDHASQRGGAPPPPPPPPTAAEDPLRAWAALVPRAGIQLASRVGNAVLVDVACTAQDKDRHGTTGRLASAAASSRHAMAAEEPAAEGVKATAAGVDGWGGHIKTSTVRSLTTQPSRQRAGGSSSTTATQAREAVPFRHDKVTMLLQPTLGLRSTALHRDTPGRRGGHLRPSGSTPYGEDAAASCQHATVLCFACVSPCSLGEVLPRCAFQPLYERHTSHANQDDADTAVGKMETELERIRAKNRQNFPAVSSRYASGTGAASDKKATDPADPRVVGVNRRGKVITAPSAATMLERMLARYETAGPLLLSEAGSTLAFAAKQQHSGRNGAESKRAGKSDREGLHHR